MHPWLVQNDEERRRLMELVERVSDEELRRIVHDEWTVAAKLGHLAFWDRLALQYFDRFIAGEEIEDGAAEWQDHVLNDAALHDWLALEPRLVARMAVEAATAMDSAVAALPGSAIEELYAAESWLLRRFRHRAEHLDELETALGLATRGEAGRVP